MRNIVMIHEHREVINLRAQNNKNLRVDNTTQVHQTKDAVPLLCNSSEGRNIPIRLFINLCLKLETKNTNQYNYLSESLQLWS